MTRNTIPYGFYPSESDRGRELIAAHRVDVARLLPAAMTEADPDDLVAGATRMMLNVRGIDAVVAQNRHDIEAMGLTEEDVPRLIAEYPKERRGH